MNPIPGHPDAPLPPAKATTMHYQGIIPEAQIPVEDVDFATIPLTCDHIGAEHFLTGPSGHTYRVKCPESCLEFNKGSVFGTMVYAEESSICKAAIHAGFIKDH